MPPINYQLPIPNSKRALEWGGVEHVAKPPGLSPFTRSHELFPVGELKLELFHSDFHQFEQLRGGGVGEVGVVM